LFGKFEKRGCSVFAGTGKGLGAIAIDIYIALLQVDSYFRVVYLKIIALNLAFNVPGKFVFLDIQLLDAVIHDNGLATFQNILGYIVIDVIAEKSFDSVLFLIFHEIILSLKLYL
jgi:hypothetical protein